MREWLGFEADGDGDHLLLKVRKRGANTLWVAKQLARLAKIDPRDVGFAGLKDRDAVTEQSFTVPARSAIGEAWVGVAGEGFEVVAAARHRRKLKRGALKGNDFDDRCCASSAAIATALEAAAARHRDGRRAELLRSAALRPRRGNLRTRARVVRGRCRACRSRGSAASRCRRRAPRSSTPSLARARARRQLESAAAGRDRRISTAAAASSSPTSSMPRCEERCARLDIHPTGPLWGGRGIGSAQLAALEARSRRASRRSRARPEQGWAGAGTPRIAHSRRSPGVDDRRRSRAAALSLAPRRLRDGGAARADRQRVRSGRRPRRDE